MSATNANPTGKVGNERENNQGVDFDSSHVADKEELDFKSGDIERKQGKDYFVNIDQKEVHRIEQRKAHKEAVRARKKFLRDNNGKIKVYSLIYIGIVILALVGVLVAAIMIKNHQDEQREILDGGSAREQELAARGEEAFTNFEAIRNKYLADAENASVETAYESAKKSTITLLDKTEDNYAKVSIVAQFCTLSTSEANKPEETLKFLADYEQYATDDEHKIIIYSSYAQAYRKLGDTEKLNDYLTKIEQLAPAEE